MRTISQQQPLCHHATGSPSATKTHNQQKGTSQRWHTGENSTTKQLHVQNQAGTTYTYISVEICDTQQEGRINQCMETLHKNSHEKPPLQKETPCTQTTICTTTPVYTRGVHNTQTLTGTACRQTGIQTRCTPCVHTYRAQAQTHAPPAAPVRPSLVQQLSTDARAHSRSAAQERAAAGKGEGEARERARRTRTSVRAQPRRWVGEREEEEEEEEGEEPGQAPPSRWSGRCLGCCGGLAARPAGKSRPARGKAMRAGAGGPAGSGQRGQNRRPRACLHQRIPRPGHRVTAGGTTRTQKGNVPAVHTRERKHSRTHTPAQTHA